MHLVWDYGQDPYMEYDLHLSIGVDGYFSDFPQTARQFIKWKKGPKLFFFLQKGILGGSKIADFML